MYPKSYSLMLLHSQGFNAFSRAIHYLHKPSRNTPKMVSSWATTGNMQTGRRATAALKPSSLAVLGIPGVMQL